MKKFINLMLIAEMFITTVSCHKLSAAPGKAETGEVIPDFRIVIVGGGPAGLATAIEGANAGARVTVVEKRAKYTRQQTIFLDKFTMKLIRAWEIHCPQISSPSETVGIVKIQDLERAMKEKARQLGVSFTKATYMGTGHHSVEIEQETGRSELDFDLLVGADGAKSQVRNKAGINFIQISPPAFGTGCVLSLGHPSRFDIDKDQAFHGHHIGKFLSEEGTSVVFSHSKTPLSKKGFTQLAKLAGFDEEAEILRKNPEKILFQNIGISLAQADRFISGKHSVIIVGDAAATASFFDGQGANTAIATAKIAGNYIREQLLDNPDASQNFAAKMKARTDFLIQQSLHLYQK